MVVCNGQRFLPFADVRDVLASLSATDNPDGITKGPAIVIVEVRPEEGANVGRSESLGLAQVVDGLERIETLLSSDRRPSLEQREIDFAIIQPLVANIAEIVDRIERELSDEEGDGVFGALRDCRKADREELLNTVRCFGVDQFRPARGDVFDARSHRVAETRAAQSTCEVDRVCRVLRPGYKRVVDGWVIRPAWVAVWVKYRGSGGSRP
jgi:molecular chaperone GrpE (heat shock protein)